jgi:hypothetical protein
MHGLRGHAQAALPSVTCPSRPPPKSPVAGIVDMDLLMMVDHVALLPVHPALS